MTDPGDKLNKRVWKLFERAGFETLPNSGGLPEETVTLPGSKKVRTVDLSASDKVLGIKIVGENTTSNSKNLKEPISSYIMDLEALAKTVGAKRRPASADPT